MLRIGFGSRVLFLHVKVKVCDPKAPRDCSSPLLVPPPCTFLTRVFSVERAQLTCWCSAVRRRSQESSFGASWPSCSNSAPSSAPSPGCQYSCRSSSTPCSSVCCSWRRYPSGSGRCIGRWPTLACRLAGRPAPVLGRAWTRRSRPRTALAAPCACTSASIDLSCLEAVRESASAAVGGGVEARACGHAVSAVPHACVEVGRVAWARVRARYGTAEVLVLPLGRSRSDRARRSCVCCQDACCRLREFKPSGRGSGRVQRGMLRQPWSGLGGLRAAAEGGTAYLFKFEQT